MYLSYARNKHAGVIELPDGNILARTVVEEDFFAARVEITVSVPGLEIVSISASIDRCFSEACHRTVAPLADVTGLRIGPGIIKLVNQTTGGTNGCPRLADLILECCEQVILRFTLDPLKQILDKQGREMIDAYKVFLSRNPRLLNSCIAFAGGSPLREGLEVEDF
ncbi:DUF2889 domain-containing protein [Desulfotomaculum copahuensis]|uniref:DUF2889 domain-containing protein n=1 Tax=Desulfotomaculum copahuensis TaxID=1838280 RepID=A0A1B7LDY8_9FIRM|nr:DUF2889 domain-containing protein [Desulfotomaculum copahuensis]OAT81309.1 hypothetical protein A6M21_00490 [Desulfotomaculum copahuensis]